MGLSRARLRGPRWVSPPASQACQSLLLLLRVNTPVGRVGKKLVPRPPRPNPRCDCASARSSAGCGIRVWVPRSTPDAPLVVLDDRQSTFRTTTDEREAAWWAVHEGHPRPSGAWAADLRSRTQLVLLEGSDSSPESALRRRPLRSASTAAARGARAFRRPGWRRGTRSGRPDHRPGSPRPRRSRRSRCRSGRERSRARHGRTGRRARASRYRVTAAKRPPDGRVRPLDGRSSTSRS